MFRRAALIVTALTFVAALSACGGDSSDDGANTTAVVDGAPAPASSATDDGNDDDGSGGGGSGGPIDCAAVEFAFGALIVNSQVIVQLANQSDITQWSTIVGTMPEFAAQLDTLRALEQYGDDVAASIDFYAEANEIAQRGYAGDAGAAEELAAFVGTDVGAALAKRTPLAIAFDAADC